MASLTMFIDIAEKIGLPVKMLRYVQARFDIGTTTGGSHTTQGAANKLRLNKDKMEALKSATIGGIDVKGELEFDNEQEAVEDLYHEATHAYIKLKLAEPDAVGLRVKSVMADAAMYYVRNAPENYFTNLADPSQLSARSFGGVPAEHQAPAILEAAKKGRPLGSSPLAQQILARGRQMASEAASMYVAHRAGKYWYTHDWLVWDRNLLRKELSSGEYVRKPLTSYGNDKINAEVQSLFGAQRGYSDAMKKLVHGYYQTEIRFFGIRKLRQHKLERPNIDPKLKELCDDILEHKIPDHFFASQSFTRLSAEIVGLIEKMRAAREATP